jgi:hypothetical protein
MEALQRSALPWSRERALSAPLPALVLEGI